MLIERKQQSGDKDDEQQDLTGTDEPVAPRSCELFPLQDLEHSSVGEHWISWQEIDIEFAAHTREHDERSEEGQTEESVQIGCRKERCALPVVSFSLEKLPEP